MYLRKQYRIRLLFFSYYALLSIYSLLRTHILHQKMLKATLRSSQKHSETATHQKLVQTQRQQNLQLLLYFQAQSYFVDFPIHYILNSNQSLPQTRIINTKRRPYIFIKAIASTPTQNPPFSMTVLTDPFLLAKSKLYGYILRTRGKISIITIIKAQKRLNRDQYIQEDFENRGKRNQRWKIQNIGSLVNFKIFIIRKLSFLIAQQHLKPSQYSFHIPAQSSKTFASPDFYRSPSFLSYSPSSSPLTICFFGSQNPFPYSPYSSLTVILMSTSKRYDLSIDLTTNPIYYAISYNNSMGKSLRTREVLTDTDHDNEEDNTALPISHSVGSGFLRKISKSKLAGKKESSTRINNFKKRVQTNQIADIMSQQRFECPICLELLINPVMMSCGHVYCYRCLQSNAAYSERCCLCRSEQKGDPHVSLTIIEKLIEHFVLPSSDELIRYLCRTTDSLEWSKRRRINNWKQGLVVDFQDRCHVWRRGVIVSTSPTQVQIKINIKGIDLFEKVENNSRRLAPYTFFTRGRYLEDFPTTLPEHDTTQRELMKLEYKPSWVEENAFQFRELELLESEPMDHSVSEEDEALRLFNFQMNELDSILNL